MLTYDTPIVCFVVNKAPKPKLLEIYSSAKTRHLVVFVTRNVDITTSVSFTDIMSDTQSVDPIARISPVLLEFTAQHWILLHSILLHCNARTALHFTALYCRVLLGMAIQCPTQDKAVQTIRSR